jgi:sugar phosphate isomerase/epimerase
MSKHVSEAAKQVKEQLNETSKLGGKICFMCLVPEDKTMPRSESFEIFTKTFPNILKEAESLDIKIVLEGFPGQPPFFPTLGCTPETLRAMFEAVPSPALCINYDPSHLIRLGIDPIRFLREFRERIGHVHAKDCVWMEENTYLYGNMPAAFGTNIAHSVGPWRYTIPGEGEADWENIGFELEQIGYDGAVCIELEDHRYKGTVELHRKGLLKSLDVLQRTMR